MSGSAAGDFTIAAGTTCTGGSSVPAGGRCAVAVAFAPKETGERTGTLEVTHGGAGGPVAVTLTGTGAGRATTRFSPGQADLGEADVGTTTSPATFTVTNTGSADLTLTSIALKGGSARSFVITGAGTCAGGATVRPGSSCTVTVAFAPLAAGAASATLSIVTAGAEQTASLAARGVQAAGSSTRSTP